MTLQLYIYIYIRGALYSASVGTRRLIFQKGVWWCADSLLWLNLFQERNLWQCIGSIEYPWYRSTGSMFKTTLRLIDGRLCSKCLATIALLVTYQQWCSHAEIGDANVSSPISNLVKLAWHQVLRCYLVASLRQVPYRSRLIRSSETQGAWMVIFVSQNPRKTHHIIHGRHITSY